jgi:hypothetical protein
MGGSFDGQVEMEDGTEHKRKVNGYLESKLEHDIGRKMFRDFGGKQAFEDPAAWPAT